MRYFPVMLLLCSPAFANDATIEERLAKLETQVRQLQAENQELRAKLGLPQPALPMIAPRPVAPHAEATAAGSERRLQIGGRVQVQAESGDAIDARYSDNNSRIFLRRARLNASGRFARQFDFRTEIEMTGTIATAAALRAQLTDGYISWIPSPALNIRAGEFKTPFGFEQLYPGAQLFTPERTLGNDRLTLSRQIGVSAFGTLARRFTYSAGAFNGNGTNISGNDNNRFLYAGRISSPLWTGRIGSTAARISAGVNGFTSGDTALVMPADFGFKGNSFTGNRNGLGADAQVTLGPADLWAEWLRDRFDPVSRIPFSSFDARAFSILAAYTFQKFQFVARFDTFDPDARLSAALSTKTWDGGLNYLIHGHDLKLQLHFVRATTNDAAHDRVIARLQTMF